MDWQKTAHGDIFRDCVMATPPYWRIAAFYALKNINTKILYNINKYGFRADEFVDEDQTRAAFGCSFTYGYEVPEQSAWPYILGAFNFGVPGGSIQTVTRLVKNWIPESSINEVFILAPSKSRREIFDPLTKTFLHINPQNIQEIIDVIYHKTIDTEKEKFLQFLMDYPHLNIFDEKSNGEIFDECLETIKTCCANRDLIIISEDELQPNDMLSRCGTHPGESWHRKTAKKFLNG